MSTAVVPFEQMERMAATVAKSGLFGMKTTEQALALMCLAQAEGIHPMIAVRDYHIMDGRPSMKAETMLARFQESGGVVEWHALDDQRCEATFSHPKSPKPVRIEWTLEQAQRAGLAKKTVWVGYGRAMLRSRTVSEGVRTCYPACIAGKYTPEEIQSLPPDAIEATATVIAERVEAARGDRLSQEQAEGFVTAIRVATTAEVLRANYAEAYSAARAVGDVERMKTFQLCYEARKGELAEAV